MFFANSDRIETLKPLVPPNEKCNEQEWAVLLQLHPLFLSMGSLHALISDRGEEDFLLSTQGLQCTQVFS